MRNARCSVLLRLRNATCEHTWCGWAPTPPRRCHQPLPPPPWLPITALLPAKWLSQDQGLHAPKSTLDTITPDLTPRSIRNNPTRPPSRPSTWVIVTVCRLTPHNPFHHVRLKQFSSLPASPPLSCPLVLATIIFSYPGRPPTWPPHSTPLHAPQSVPQTASLNREVPSICNFFSMASAIHANRWPKNIKWKIPEMNNS